ncbi:hypothetical protein E4U55_001322 [Claviceps digitariae]|nr:hypothetical protein E4U55_001322 [Claviceps digitariae]
MALQASLDEHARLLDQLKTLPEDKAIQLLLDVRVRSKSDDASMDSAQGAMHGQYRPSDLATAKCLFPRTDSFLEFELGARHPFIYPKTTPLDPAQLVAFLNSSALTVTGEPSKALSSSPQASKPPSLSSGRPLVTSQSEPIAITATAFLSDTATPEASESIQLCDPRLGKLDIKFWTSVPIPNALAASVISFHLENDHPIMGVFDADLFLTDLVEQRLEHCSPFLVSAVLCFACQAYARRDPQAMTYVVELIQEATTLWQSERNLTRNHLPSSASSVYEPVTTLAATVLMSLACQNYGIDGPGYEFLRASRQIATELGLLDAALDSDRLETLGKRSKEWQRSASYAAWATYNWISEPPIQHPPTLPVPGSADAGPVHHGNSDAGSDGMTTSLSLSMGRTFQTLCGFWTLMQEVFAVYNNRLDPRPLRERVSLAFAEAKYQKLLAWSDSVESSVSRGEHSSGHVLIFQ